VNNNLLRFTLGQNEKFINIPIELNFDLTGREDAIDRFEKEKFPKYISNYKQYL
jgi:hypothetical protein